MTKKYLACKVPLDCHLGVLSTNWLNLLKKTTFQKGDDDANTPKTDHEISFFHRNLVKGKHSFVLGEPKKEFQKSQKYPGLDTRLRIVDFQTGYRSIYVKNNHDHDVTEFRRPVGMLVADFDDKPKHFSTFSDFKEHLEQTTAFNHWIFITSRGGRVKGFALIEQCTADSKRENCVKRKLALSHIFAEYLQCMDLAFDAVSQSFFTDTMREEFLQKASIVRSIGHLNSLSEASIPSQILPFENTVNSFNVDKVMLPTGIETICQESRSLKIRAVVRKIMIAFRDGRRETPLNQKKIQTDTGANAELVCKTIKQLELQGWLKCVYNENGHSYIPGKVSKTYKMNSYWYDLCDAQGFFTSKRLPEMVPGDGHWYEYLKAARSHFTNAGDFMAHVVRLPGIARKDRLSTAHRFARYLEKATKDKIA